MSASRIGRVGRARSRPTIRAGIVSPAGVQKAEAITRSALDNHFAAGPHCCVRGSARRRVGGGSSCPAICAGIILPTGVKIARGAISTPDDHFAAGPDRSVRVPGSGRIGDAGWSPRVVNAATRGTSYNRKRVGNLP